MPSTERVEGAVENHAVRAPARRQIEHFDDFAHARHQIELLSRGLPRQRASITDRARRRGSAAVGRHSALSDGHRGSHRRDPPTTSRTSSMMPKVACTEFRASLHKMLQDGRDRFVGHDILQFFIARTKPRANRAPGLPKNTRRIAAPGSASRRSIFAGTMSLAMAAICRPRGHARDPAFRLFGPPLKCLWLAAGSMYRTGR